MVHVSFPVAEQRRQLLSAMPAKPFAAHSAEVSLYFPSQRVQTILPDVQAAYILIFFLKYYNQII